MRFIRYFLICVVCLVLGIVYSREVPKLKKWILAKVTSVSRGKGVEISAREIDFKLFPPGIELVDIKIDPKGVMASVIAPSTVESMQIYLSPSSLIAGRFEIGNITLNHPVTSIFLRKSKLKTAARAKSGEA